MSPRVLLTVDQLYRPAAGGIGTYIRGLIGGLTADATVDLRLLAPRGENEEVRAFGRPVVSSRFDARLAARAWKFRAGAALGDIDILHATSMTGPFRAPSRGKASVTVHDLLWRDAPETFTAQGRSFHERRWRTIRSRDELTIMVTTENMRQRVVSDGVDLSRVHVIRLGLGGESVVAATVDEVKNFLRGHDVDGPFTLHVGTREPRKNLDRLVAAHAEARRVAPELGELLLVGPPGWGSDRALGARTLGTVSPEMLRGLYRDAHVVAYVPLTEGWGLPPLEALREGATVVASRTTPSVSTNPLVELVSPDDVDEIAEGLRRAGALSVSDALRETRRASVAEMTWARCAQDHLRGWQ